MILHHLKGHNMLYRFISIANKLDQRGLYIEADLLTKIASIMVSKNNLIKTLKNDDTEAAMKAFNEFIATIPSYTNPAEELGLTPSNFNYFLQKLKRKDLWAARKILGIGENTQPVPKPQNNKLSAEEVDAIKRFINQHSINDTRLFNDLTKKYGKGTFGTAARLLNDILDIGDKEINIKNFSSNYEHFIRDIVKDWNTQDFYVNPKIKKLLESAADKLK